jgi:hypothetical protein
MGTGKTISPSQDPIGQGQLHALGLIEELRAECSELWGTSSTLHNRIDELHIRWVIAASASVAVGHAALDAAIASYPEQRFTLRNGIQVIREYVPTA